MKQKVPTKKSITIVDIARKANVSPTAVSMALNNSKGLSTKTRKKILKIAEKLNYQPNYAAKSLISRRSYTISFVLSDITNPFYPELALGIERKADELGYSLFLFNTDGSLEKEKKAIGALRAKGVDGIILATATIDNPSIRSLVEDRFPFVLVNRRFMDSETDDQYVVLDDYACGYEGVRHLFRIGHERIAIIAGAVNASTALMRTKGSTEAFADFGIKADRKLLVECDYVGEKAYQATKLLLGIILFQ